MNNNALLQLMALDLKRVAIGYHSGSSKMATRFLKEALIRKTQLNTSTLPPALRKLVDNLDKVFEEKNTEKLADDALMYSTLLISFSKNHH